MCAIADCREHTEDCPLCRTYEIRFTFILPTLNIAVTNVQCIVRGSLTQRGASVPLLLHAYRKEFWNQSTPPHVFSVLLVTRSKCFHQDFLFVFGAIQPKRCHYCQHPDNCYWRGCGNRTAKKRLDNSRVSRVHHECQQPATAHLLTFQDFSICRKGFAQGIPAANHENQSADKDSNPCP